MAPPGADDPVGATYVVDGRPATAGTSWPTACTYCLVHEPGDRRHGLPTVTSPKM